jgi:hypothetical protein
VSLNQARLTTREAENVELPPDGDGDFDMLDEMSDEAEAKTDSDEPPVHKPSKPPPSRVTKTRRLWGSAKSTVVGIPDRSSIRPRSTTTSRKVTKATKQLQVTRFTVREPLPEPMETDADDVAASVIERLYPTASPEVEYVATLPYVPAPAGIQDPWTDLKTRIEMFEIQTPRNGSCYFYMIYAMTYGSCETQLPTSGTPLRQAVRNRFHLYKYMTDLFDQLIYTGVIDLKSACRRVTGKDEVTKAAVNAVNDHYWRARTAPCDETVGSEYWAGENEIKATAHWLNTPLIIFERTVDGRVMAQLYYPCPAVTPQYPGQETVCQVYLAADVAADLVRSMLTREIIPLVGVLTHEGTGTSTIGHFNALRVNPRLYGEWAGTKKKQAAMKKRISALLKEEHFYPKDVENLSLPSETLSAPTLSPPDSEYTPSASLSDLSDREPPRQLFEPQSTGRQRAAAAASTAPVDAQEVMSRGKSAADETSARNQGSIVHSTSPQLQLAQRSSEGTSDSRATPSPTLHSLPASEAGTPDLAGENEIQALVAACTRELHENLRMMPGYNAVVKANRSAYAQWRRDQASTHPGLLKLLGKSNSVSAACERLTDRHDQLVSMLSSLPCIPIVFKYTQSELLRDIGRDVYVQGRVHLLRLLATNTSTPPPARRLSIEWASGIQAIHHWTGAGRWLTTQLERIGLLRPWGLCQCQGQTSANSMQQTGRSFSAT